MRNKKGNILVVVLASLMLVGFAIIVGYLYFKNNNKPCGGLAANLPEYQCPFPFVCKQLKGNAPDTGGTCVLIFKNPEPLVNLPYPKTAPNIGSEMATTSTDPTANWKTYTNARHGYEIKYPNTWKVGIVSSSDNLDTASTINFREVSDQTPYVESGYAVSVMSQEDSFVSQICLKSGPYMGGANTQGFLCGQKVQAASKIINGINWEVLQPDSVGMVPSGTVIYNTTHNHKLYYVISFTDPKETFFYDQILSTFKFTDQNNVQGTMCGGWDTSGQIICGCSSGQMTKTLCPVGTVCDSGTYYCQGQCGVCCYKGIGVNPKYSPCD